MSILKTLTQRFQASGPGRWYRGREPNEQRIVLALTVAALITVLWLGIWKPVSDWRSVEHNRYQNAQSLLDWMHANEARARAAAGSDARPGGNRSVLPVITRSAEAQGIRLNRLQPESNAVVSVVIQAQPFNDVLGWLHQLQESSGITIQRLSIDAEGTSGLVNAQIRLQ